MGALHHGDAEHGADTGRASRETLSPTFMLAGSSILEGVVPRLGEDVPRWYGETIGFWDEDVLITWTSNIQAWKNHSAPEHSNMMQTVEIYTPNR